MTASEMLNPPDNLAEYAAMIDRSVRYAGHHRPEDVTRSAVRAVFLQLSAMDDAKLVLLVRLFGNLTEEEKKS